MFIFVVEAPDIRINVNMNKGKIYSFQVFREVKGTQIRKLSLMNI